MADFLQRQWVMLSLLPRAPRSVDAATLEAKLREHGIKVNRRSIQRDLIALSSMFPIACDERSKPYGWSWAEEGFGIEAPGNMSPHAALAFKLAVELLAGALPRPTLAYLRGRLRSAETALEGSSEPLASWTAKVRVVPPIAPMPRDVRPGVFELVLTSLLEDRRFLASLKDGGSRAQHTIHPLGLVFRESTPILVCTVDNGKPKQMRLSSVASARPSLRARVVPDGFDLDAFLGAHGRAAGGAPKRARRARRKAR